MFGSIYIGLSGLTAYSRGLKQISNNIANLNSMGFKGSTTSFENLLGAGARSGFGYATDGTGNGVRTGSNRIDFAQGEMRPTDRDLDLAVQGSGFLMLMRDDEIAYTRTGSFEVDTKGFIVLSGTDYRLATLDASGRPVSLSIDASRTSAPNPTTKVSFSENISSGTTSYSVGNIAVYDTTGAKHVWQAQFTKGAVADTSWTVTVTDDKGSTIGTNTLTFAGGLVDPATQSLVFTDAGTGLAVNFDFSQGVRSFSTGTVSTLRASDVDGYPSGTVTAVRVNADGQLEIGYSNEQKLQLGAVAIAGFHDPAALEQRSGGLFVDRGGADRELYASGDVRVGKVQSRQLEASNVDLTVEFSDLILVQRGFQASSQIISVTNEMIQQLFGIRGQG